MTNYQPHFPYPAIRDEQKTAIEFALDAFQNQDKRFVIVEAGTGVGKSAVGLTVAKTIAQSSYFLTTQKILQHQYMDDFGTHGMLSLKSSTNFRCKYYKAKIVAKLCVSLRFQRTRSSGLVAAVDVIIKLQKENLLMVL